MIKTLASLIALASVLSGCSGVYQTEILDGTKLAVGTKLDGIIVPMNKLYKETTVLMEDKDGGTDCEHVTSVKLVTYPNWQTPLLISYKPGLLEKYSLQVALTDNGALKSLNIDSTPDNGATIKNLAEATKAKALVGTKPCTDGAETSVVPYQ
ncbi:MAG: hypothetical protein QM647_08915 [Asticcacaulis sp.]|uniref:hypothetical protein n=1 Tax=Asticcacaulis sp. TaxID=1872648 RepID=UPI0039E339DF